MLQEDLKMESDESETVLSRNSLVSCFNGQTIPTANTRRRYEGESSYDVLEIHPFSPESTDSLDHIQSHASSILPKRRGRPKKSDDTKYWEDFEIDALIELWSRRENLYNTKHPKYFDKDYKQESLEHMQSSLKKQCIIANVKEITEKLTNLKNYYGGQQRLIENSILQGNNTDQIYESKWKFFNKLHFLTDAINRRKPYTDHESSGHSIIQKHSYVSMADKRNIDYYSQKYGDNKCSKVAKTNYSQYVGDSIPDINIHEDFDDDIYEVSMRNKIIDRHVINNKDSGDNQNNESNKNKGDNNMDKNNPATSDVSAVGKSLKSLKQSQSTSISVTHKNEDRIFCELIYEKLRELPDCKEKELAKLKFQQDLMQIKFPNKTC